MADEHLFREVELLLTQGGAALVGCGDLGPVPAEVRHGLPLGISIGVALSPQIVAGITRGPTTQYAEEYRRANALLDGLAADVAVLLRELGFQAVAGRTTVDKLDPQTLATPLPHKTVATRAGLGWIGKSALLITRRYGSAVRYNTVLTDAPLPVGTPVETSRCGKCTACVEACPVAAPSGRDWRVGQGREVFFDAFACCRNARETAAKIGIRHTICGICIAVCPHTKRYTDERPNPRRV
jgi:epoxyqueuosine reductase